MHGNHSINLKRDFGQSTRPDFKTNVTLNIAAKFVYWPSKINQEKHVLRHTAHAKNEQDMLKYNETLVHNFACHTNHRNC